VRVLEANPEATENVTWEAEGALGEEGCPAGCVRAAWAALVT
jgi:hypothetical protein